MTAIIFDGKAAADAIAAELKAEIKRLGLKPRLVDIAIEPDERSRLYMQTKQTRAHQIGIELDIQILDFATMGEAQVAIREAVADRNTHGVMLQLPVPIGFVASKLVSLIPARKDVDGLNFMERGEGYPPATAAAVIEILRLHKVKLQDLPIAVIGQGPLVGQPLTLLLRQAGANVSVADDQTLELAELTYENKVVISATGVPKLITADMIQPGAIVIDVGIAVENGQPASDVDFAAVRDKASFITPPIGGVGPMTVIELMRNVVTATKHRKPPKK